MDLTSDEERWAVWMVQARRFAERENFTDAVARVKLVRNAVRKALGSATDPIRRGRLERHLARADEDNFGRVVLKTTHPDAPEIVIRVAFATGG